MGLKVIGFTIFLTPRMMEVCWSELIGDENTTDSFEHQVSINLS